MRISDKMDDTTIDTLSIQIESVFKDSPELTHKEIMIACMHTIGNVLMSVSCPDCRQASALFLEKQLPRFIKRALTEAEKLSEQPLDGHIH